MSFLGAASTMQDPGKLSSSPSTFIENTMEHELQAKSIMSPAPKQRSRRSSVLLAFSPAPPSQPASTPSQPVTTAEDQLIDTLLAIEGDEISFDVFQFVIDMLEDISKCYISGQSCRDIFRVIFSLLVKAAPPIQSRVAATLNQLIATNPGIMQFTKDTEWLSELLVYLPRFEDTSVLDELFKLIETLGSYHITVKQVKMIFKLFQVDNTQFQAYYWQNIFPLLQRLWHGRDGRPNDYFELDGYNSGLMLPNLKLPSGGYSIATWVSVTSFSSLYTRDSYQPYLFSFLSEDGSVGIECHFNRGKLVIRTNPNHPNASKREVRIVNYDFQENRWYFVAFTHTKKLILSDECHVYVNGESVQHFNLKYPKHDQYLKSSRLGTAGFVPEPKNCLRGKLAGFLAFDETLNPDEVRALYNHGPNLFSSLRPLEQLVLMPRSRLSKRPNVLFFYSPRATDCSVCLEPWTNDTTRRANMLPGVRSCITTGIQESLSSVGGIQLLLPLFSSKYRPSIGETLDVNTKVISLITELVTDNEYSQNQMYRSRFFEIMGYLLATDFQGSSHQPSTNPAGTPENQNVNTTEPVNQSNTDASSHTGSHHGHHKVKASNKWSVQSVEVLDKLANVICSYGATNASKTNGPLFKQLFRHVYLNFHIWNTADFEVQLGILKSIQQFVKKDPETFHSFVSVQELMIILSQHFTYLPNLSDSHQSAAFNPALNNTSLLKKSSSTLHSNFVHAFTQTKVDWSKKPRQQLVELRKALLGTLHCLMQVGLQLKETKSIIAYLHAEVSSKTEDRRLITDVLQILLIGIGEKHPSLLSQIHKMGNLLIFLPLLKTENEKFRVWTLKVIGKLIQNSESETQQREDVLAHLPSLRKVLEPYPLTLHTYNVLLEILIDTVSADGLINPVELALHPSTPPGAAVVTLRNLSMISVIFQLLNARSDYELRIKVIKDFIFYLKKGPENRAKFTAQHDWQTWLLSLLVVEPNVKENPTTVTNVTTTARRTHRRDPSAAGQPTHSPNPANTSSNAAATSSYHQSSENHLHSVLLGLVTEVFSLIFEASFLQTATNANQIFEGTAAVLKRMSQINGLDTISIANTINTRVLKTLMENNIVVRCKASSTCFQTVVQYLIFVESTLFSPPVPQLSVSSPAIMQTRLISPGTSPSLKSSLDIPESSSPGPTTSSTSETIASGEKDAIKFGDRQLLPLLVQYGSNGLWISFTLAQRILDLVDQLVLNKVDRTNPANLTEVAPEILDRLEAHLFRLRTRLVLYSITEGSSFKSTTRLKMRKDSIRNIRQVIYDGFTSATSKSLSFGADLPMGGIHASLGRYLAKKAKQWDLEMSDVDTMFYKNIKRIRALLESTTSNHAALFLTAFIGALVQKSTSQANTQAAQLAANSSANSSQSPSNSSPQQSLLAMHNSSGSKSNLLSVPSSPSPSQQPSIAAMPTSPSSSNQSPNQVAQQDESLQLTQQLWLDAIQIIKSRLKNDDHYGPMFSNMDGDVLVSFFENGFANPKDFVLTPAIERAVDHIIANDLNAVNASAQALKVVAEKFTDETQALTLAELESHKAYEQMWTKFCNQAALAAYESQTLYEIRYSQYISLIASQWKNLLRVLLDTRGPWSSPYAAGDKMYWKLDPSENPQRMRMKLKRHYGDVSEIEQASGKNDEKERLMIESLTGIISPSASLSTLPSFDAVSNSSSSSQTSSNQLKSDLLLKYITRRNANAQLDDDNSSLIDIDYSTGQDISSTSSDQADKTMSPSPSSQNLSGSSSISSASNSNQSTNSSKPSISEERTVLTTTCEYIKGISSIAGVFEITTTNLYFRNIEEGIFKTIPLEKIKSIYSRRFMLQNVALEIFTTNKTSHFFHFDKEPPAQILKVIVDLRPQNLREYFAGSSRLLARKKKHITEAWRKRQISNFEYLMELNTIAGRSYNDLSQYPVFPWIIADYESEKLDLNNPNVYRDLSKPIGALEPNRLEKFLSRWNEMIKNDDENHTTPPFLYGSHYSSHSIVLYYLLRLEPFTTQALRLQGGQFDLPARLFNSIPDTWKNCLINQSDVKELTPEFFFLPSFLTNPNDINLGSIKAKDPSESVVSSSGIPGMTSIDSVQLPPWANSAQSFVQMNRMALESEYVSAHLHEWIDLIFGYKQTGQDAIDANNVFYYTSYEGSIDIDSITDPTIKQSVQMQIREFGQTPSQLFTSPHPARITLEELQKSKRTVLTNLVNVLNAASSTPSEPEWKPTTADLGKTFSIQNRPGTVANAEIISIHVDYKNEKIIITFMDGLVLPIAYKIPKGKRFPITLTPAWQEQEVIGNPQKKEDHSLDNTACAPGLNPSQGCFALSGDGKILINGGSWDRSINVSQISNSSVSLTQTVMEHKDVVTTVVVSQDNTKLISASKDCNVLVWELETFVNPKKRADKEAPPKPKFVLFGHDDTINHVAVNSDLDILVTASEDRTSIIYDLTKGHYTRTIIHDAPVDLVCVSKFGDIVTYCSQGECLYLHTVNGALLQKLTGVGKLTSMRVSADGTLLVTAGQNIITVRTLYQYTMKRLYVWKCPTSVSAIELFNQDEYLLIGLCDGTLLTVIFDMHRLLTDMALDVALEKSQ